MNHDRVAYLPDNAPCVFILDNIDGHKSLVIPGAKWVELGMLEEFVELKFGRILVRPYGMIKWRGGTVYLLSRTDFRIFLKSPIRSHNGEESDTLCPDCGGPGLTMFNKVDCFRGC